MHLKNKMLNKEYSKMQNKRYKTTIFMLIGMVTMVIVGFLYFSKDTARH